MVNSIYRHDLSFPVFVKCEYNLKVLYLWSQDLLPIGINFSLKAATRMELASGVTPLGSGWANPRAPGLGGHPSEGVHFLKLSSILLIHNITLYLGAPSNPLEHVNCGCPVNSPKIFARFARKLK